MRSVQSRENKQQVVQNRRCEKEGVRKKVRERCERGDVRGKRGERMIE